MATTKEQRDAVDAAAHEAQLAVLRVITEKAGERTPSAIRDLAEAYAWLNVPGQPHGGHSVTKT